MPVQTMTAETLRPAKSPTMYFIGVTTGASSIQRVFPVWATELQLDARLRGVDLPIHAPAHMYRRVVEFIRDDPFSLGALVTTHKIDLYNAASDLFSEADPLSSLMGEISCISKQDGRLVCAAKDPISCGLALDAFIPAGYWAEHPKAQVAILGAGGSAIAISWYLSRPERGADRPARIVTSNRSASRLDHLRGTHAGMGTDTKFDYVLATSAGVNDGLVSELPAGSLVVNATGLGKDAPGSPLTHWAVFPLDGLVWELNYRGDLVFLQQAQTQQTSRGLRIEDGWVYFVHGWSRVIAEVFHVDIPTSGPEFDRLSDAAKAVR